MEPNLNINSAIKNPFGLRNDKIVLINELNEAERGLNCCCVCPSCNMSLSAKLGYGKKIPHFAHNNIKCKSTYSYESGLHLLAKEILCEMKKIKIPKVEKSFNFDLDLFPTHIRNKLEPNVFISNEKIIEFDEVIVEDRIDSIFSDITLIKNNQKLVIEIAVTHFVDSTKLNKLKKMGLSTIEIDFSKLDRERPNRDVIKQLLVDSTENKKWLYNEKLSKKICEVQNNNNKILAVYRKEQEIKKEKERENIEKKKKKEIEAREKILKLISNKQNYENNSDLRNDKEFYHYLNFNSSFCKFQNGTVPFFIDIPITGEFVFKTDRRIWQAELFQKFIINNKANSISHEYIANNIKNEKLYNIDWNLGRKINLNDKYGEKSLFSYVIKTYFEFLAYLGFINADESLRYKKWYSIAVKQINPPIDENAHNLKKIITNSNIQFPFYEEAMLARLLGVNLIENQIEVKKIREAEELEAVLKSDKRYEQQLIEKKRKDEAIKVSLKMGFSEIDPNYDWASEKKYYDRFNNQWIKCDICGIVKDTSRMTSYQYSHGKCSDCLRNSIY